ncbi:hypothetical protein BD410DRAFT_842002 [Rickenella mellea]|uniref:Concanavalin A-like lectin/glucanase n=1 Tax=Rickenella mellea TaxID=50990 RepID=A0A4Y7PWP5_9AGAM|nr:hypothetical protein BD410DRAFT_842002 [Rickenella mellea]
MRLIPVASLLCLSSLVKAYTYGWGTSWSIGLTPSSSIIEARTTFIPGVPPDPATQYGEIYLWPGLTNGTGDLLQTTIEQWPDQSWCGGTAGQWCLRTSVFGKSGQFDGAFAPLSANQPVTITFQRSANKTSWTQTAAVDGKVISQLTSPSGPMTGWGVATECVDDCSPAVSTQTYLDTKIVLEKADPTFGETTKVGIAGAGTVVSGLRSLEGGKVWHIAKITVPKSA